MLWLLKTFCAFSTSRMLTLVCSLFASARKKASTSCSTPDRTTNNRLHTRETVPEKEQSFRSASRKVRHQSLTISIFERDILSESNVGGSIPKPLHAENRLRLVSQRKWQRKTSHQASSCRARKTTSSVLFSSSAASSLDVRGFSVLKSVSPRLSRNASGVKRNAAQREWVVVPTATLA